MDSCSKLQVHKKRNAAVQFTSATTYVTFLSGLILSVTLPWAIYVLHLFDLFVNLLCNKLTASCRFLWNVADLLYSFSICCRFVVDSYTDILRHTFWSVLWLAAALQKVQNKSKSIQTTLIWFVVQCAFVMDLISASICCTASRHVETLWSCCRLSMCRVFVVDLLWILFYSLLYNKSATNRTRWLYCVECPQNSIRLEALVSLN